VNSQRIIDFIPLSLIISGTILPFLGDSEIGCFMILMGTMVNERTTSFFQQHKNWSYVGIIAAFFWTIGILRGGIDSLEWIQMWSVYSAGSIWITRWDSFRKYRNISLSIIILSLAQILLTALLLKWTLNIVLTGALLIGLWDQDGISFSIHADVLFLWAGFSGVRLTEIVLQGGILVPTETEILSAHSKWILILSAPILGVALFQTIRSLLNLISSDEEE